MPTSSFFHNIVIDDAEKGRMFIEAMEKAEEWAILHEKSEPEIDVDVVELNKSQIKEYIWGKDYLNDT